MAGNIGVELYLAVGEMKPVSPNFNLPTLCYCIKRQLRCLKLLKRASVFNSTFDYHILSLSVFK